MHMPRNAIFAILGGTLPWLFCLSAHGQASLAPGDYTRTVEIDGRSRSYIVHVPPKYDSKRPTPVVLAFHGALTNAAIMAVSTGLDAKADEAGFIVAYPNGTGEGGLLLFWNSGGVRHKSGQTLPDDVKFTQEILDDLAKAANVDANRVYATGISNGGMMCYRLASELSPRIAAIASVSGTMAPESCHPRRPVSVMHFHGTADKIVPFDGPNGSNDKGGGLPIGERDDPHLGQNRRLPE